VNDAHDEGVVVVAAAGNSGPAVDTIECPGMAGGAITVAAYLPAAVNRRARSQGGDESLGTSFSSAYVAGGIALLLSACPEATPEHVRTALRSGARPIAGARPEEQGAGAMYVPAALAALTALVRSPN
jgi:serine protease AprX